MRYLVGLNDIEPANWVAFVFNLFGCFARARTAEEALVAAPQAIRDYYFWLREHEPTYRIPTDRIEILASENIKSAILQDGYWANAFFKNDELPLTSDDIEWAIRLLSYSRSDLLDILRVIPDEIWDRPVAGEVRGSIRGVANHIAGAENWYFDRLDLGLPWDSLPEEIFLKLSKIREHALKILPDLAGLTTVIEKRRERWSARKVIRRMLWHEIVHTRQIDRYLRAMTAP